MIKKLFASPAFLLVGLLTSLSGVFICSLIAGRLPLGIGLLVTGSGIIYLSQRASGRAAGQVNKPGQRHE